MGGELSGRYILGLDLGVSSIGWAVVEVNEAGEPCGLRAAGSRIFPAGLDELEKGKGESPNAARRAARLRRRMLDRRSRRREKLFNTLLGAGLLPLAGPEFTPREGEGLGSPAYRSAVLNALYARLVKEEAERLGCPEEDVAVKLPYLLRLRGLREALSPSALGMAIYQLSARRGYLSNRKEPAPAEANKRGKRANSAEEEAEAEAKRAKAEEDRLVLGNIKLLEGKLSRAQTTLGGYLASLDPHDERLRARYTSRKMLLDEFEALIAAQAPHHPVLLAQGFVHRLRLAIFRQRPLKSAAHLIGACELEPKARRAPMALPSSQRYRMVAAVNNLRVKDSRRPWDKPTPLTPEQRVALLAKLGADGDMTMAEAKKLIGLRANQKLTAESMGKLKGDRTAALMRRAMGAASWEALSLEAKDAVVRDLLSVQKPETFQKRAVKLGCDPAEAQQLYSAETFEDDYLALSTKAVLLILPMLEDGMDTMTAQRHAYPERFAPTAPVTRLPPVKLALPGLRNPLVTRTLSELRRVVNAIVETWGVPFKVRLELARDLKQSAKDREKTHKKIQVQEKRRELAAKKIQSECGVARPSRGDVEKALLWEECGGICPYTGESIPFHELFGPSPRFDIEHIIPFSRCLDDSFLNKTLCQNEENRRVKGQKTPQECYGNDPARMQTILDRVKRFRGDAAAIKLERFEADAEDVEQMLTGFTERQLNDTRYASRDAAKLVGLLFGGVNDADGVSRVQASAGGVTAYLRSVWDLNRVLGGGPVKQRDDHRHHAIDAICVALTDRAVVKRLADVAERHARSPATAREERRGRLGALPPPWEDFDHDVREVIGGVQASHRQPRPLAGAIHEETHYSKPRWPAEAGSNDGQGAHVRKPLAAIKDVEAIVDPTVREAVKDFAAGRPLDRLIKADGPWPTLRTHDGREIPIKRARIRVKASTTQVGRPGAERHVKLGNNSHAEIVELRGPKGQPKYEDRVVTLLEAKTRRRQGQPIFAKAHEDGPVRWIIRRGDVLELEVAPGVRELRVVRSVSLRFYELVTLNDARLKKVIIDTGALFRISAAATFEKLNVKHVRIDALGRRIHAKP